MVLGHLQAQLWLQNKHLVLIIFKTAIDFIFVIETILCKIFDMITQHPVSFPVL